MDILSGIDGTGPLAKLIYRRAGRSRRISSWDKTGGNRDFLTIPQGATATLAQIEGAGCIRHIWITVGCRDRLYLRKTVLKMYWDDETEPSVLAPLGDFFGLGHGIARSYMSMPFTTVNHEANEGNYGGGIALNCYFPMPFSTGARLEVVNECDTEIGSFYYYIDYESYDAPLPDHVLRFHAHYRQEYHTTGTQGNLFEQRRNYWELLDTPNLSDAENYLILDAEGAGHYVGCVLSVDNIDPLPVIRKLGSQEQVIKEYTWWGEGDDMIFIDGEPWPPSLHGTGSEDYLCHAWDMHPKAYLYAGASIPETDPKHPDRRQCTSYRFHVEDPILFTQSIRVSIEHGHANLQQNDYSSVAYWYQTEPHKPLPPLPPVAERIPRNMRP